MVAQKQQLQARGPGLSTTPSARWALYDATYTRCARRAAHHWRAASLSWQPYATARARKIFTRGFHFDERFATPPSAGACAGFPRRCEARCRMVALTTFYEPKPTPRWYDTTCRSPPETCRRVSPKRSDSAGAELAATLPHVRYFTLRCFLANTGTATLAGTY